ncbi:MAG: homoserine kinase [Acidobacteria bacterium]|nr:MAG: homoserine kinase [Acidobacteriota bacterium]
MGSVAVYAPGTASNIGPGFDCFGIAFTGLGDTVRAARTNGPGVRVVAVSDERIPTDPLRNTAALGAAAVIKRAGLEREAGLELHVEKGLPLAAGMGGSAASAVAGALAAHELLKTRLTRIDLLMAAIDAEAVVSGRHADNAAPCLFGGAVIVAGLDPPEVTPVRVHESLGLVFATPAYEVATAEARRVLPAEVPRADAVGQAARLALLVLGLERGDADLVRRAIWDRIAEPRRAPLYPGYPPARTAALEAGALGVAVSGAGPTIVAVVLREARQAVAKALVEGYAKAGINARSHVAEVDATGARVV